MKPTADRRAFADPETFIRANINKLSAVQLAAATAFSLRTVQRRIRVLRAKEREEKLAARDRIKREGNMYPAGTVILGSMIITVWRKWSARNPPRRAKKWQATTSMPTPSARKPSGANPP